MASGFGSRRSKCEGVGCRATADVTYYMEEKKKLCEECATKTRYARKERKDGLNLLCKKHDKPIRIHCVTHDVSVCHLCATIDHVQQSCVRQDVEEAITEKKQQFFEL